MPSVQKRVVSVAQVLRGNAAQITKLQTFPPSGMTSLVSSSFSGGSFGWVGTFSNMNTSGTHLPQLLRPVPLLVIVTANFYASGGTASYAYVRAAIVTSIADPTVVTDVNGNPCSSAVTIATNGGAIASGTFLMTTTLPAAAANNYIVCLQYAMVTGATTVLDIPGAVLGSDMCTTDVFQLAG